MVKNDVCSMDFYIYEPKVFGMHSGSVLGGSGTGNANTDLKMSLKPICRGERVRTQGQKGRFFGVWKSWRGLL